MKSPHRLTASIAASHVTATDAIPVEELIPAIKYRSFQCVCGLYGKSIGSINERQGPVSDEVGDDVAKLSNVYPLGTA